MTKMYEKIHGVSTGGSLGPVLANIIMTECEKVIFNQQMENNIARFYIIYVDDTLKKDTNIVLKSSTASTKI